MFEEPAGVYAVAVSRSYYGIVAPVLSDCSSGLCIGTFSIVVGAPLVMLEINNIEFDMIDRLSLACLLRARW